MAATKTQSSTRVKLASIKDRRVERKTKSSRPARDKGQKPLDELMAVRLGVVKFMIDGIQAVEGAGDIEYWYMPGTLMGVGQRLAMEASKLDDLALRRLSDDEVGCLVDHGVAGSLSRIEETCKAVGDDGDPEPKSLRSVVSALAALVELLYASDLRALVQEFEHPVEDGVAILNTSVGRSAPDIEAPELLRAVVQFAKSVYLGSLAAGHNNERCKVTLPAAMQLIRAAQSFDNDQ